MRVVKLVPSIHAEKASRELAQCQIERFAFRSASARCVFADEGSQGLQHCPSIAEPFLLNPLECVNATQPPNFSSPCRAAHGDRAAIEVAAVVHHGRPRAPSPSAPRVIETSGE
jgi:hypothetical protein